MHVKCIAPLILFDLIILIIFGKEYKFSPTTYLFIPLRSKYSLQRPLLKCLQFISSLSDRGDSNLLLLPERVDK
jgi:hypothetical protein